MAIEVLDNMQRIVWTVRDLNEVCLVRAKGRARPRFRLRRRQSWDPAKHDPPVQP